VSSFNKSQWSARHLKLLNSLGYILTALNYFGVPFQEFIEMLSNLPIPLNENILIDQWKMEGFMERKNLSYETVDGLRTDLKFELPTPYFRQKYVKQVQELIESCIPIVFTQKKRDQVPLAFVRMRDIYPLLIHIIGRRWKEVSNTSLKKGLFNFF